MSIGVLIEFVDIYFIYFISFFKFTIFKANLTNFSQIYTISSSCFSSIFLKTIDGGMRLLYRNLPILSKAQCSRIIFTIFHEKLLLSCPYLIKKRQFCQNNTILWAKEVSMMPFFSHFSEKNIALIPIFCEKTSIL